MTTELLWHRGELAAAGEASTRAIAALPLPVHPFRSDAASLEHARALHEHGTRMWHLARFAEAGTALGQAHAMRKQLCGDDHVDTLATAERLAALDGYVMRDEAGAKFEAVIAALAHEPVRQAIARRNYAAYLRDSQRVPQARGQLDRATLVLERELPAIHPDVIHGLKADAALHFAEGSYEPAMVIATRAIERATQQWSATHPFTAATELTLAKAELYTHKIKEAAKRLPRVVERLEDGYGEHPLVAIALSWLARLEQKRVGRFDIAEKHARRAVAMYRRFYPERYGNLAWTLFEILMESNRPEDAAEVAEEAGAVATQRVRHAMAGRLANAFLKDKAYKQAVPWLDRARDLSESDDVREKWSAQADKWRHYVARFER